MPVPSTVADLSSTASSNYPSGSESIGTSLDDYLRSHAAIIRQVSDAKQNSLGVTPTAAGLALLDDADAAAQRTTLGVVIGTDVQAHDANTAKTNAAQNFTASQRSAPITDNDLSFDLSGAGNNYTCSFSSSGTLTFTNIAANSGKSGWIKFVVTGTPTVSAHANTKITSANLTRLGAAGTYIASYYCDGTDVYVSVGTYA